MSITIPEIPWVIEGGAKHSVQVARAVAFMAAGGTEGVVLGADLEVREQLIPDDTVRIFPGVAAIQNRATGALGEMYVAPNGTEVALPIPPTDATGPKSYLIVMQVQNPTIDNWPAPPSVPDGPYASFEAIECAAGVNSADDLGRLEQNSMLALARVDVPASTATIDQSMIVDLRVMANAVNQRTLDIIEPTVADTLSTAGYSVWPDAVNLSLDVPEWATHCRVRALLTGVKHGGPGTTNVFGDLRVKIGGSGGDITGPACRYDLDNAGGVERDTLMVVAKKLPLPKVDRGRKGVPFQIEGEKSGGDNSISVDAKSAITYEVEFINQPESNI